MKRIGQFILLGLFFAAPAEVLNQIFSLRSIHGFFATMRSYAILLLLTYLLYRFLGWFIQNPFWRQLPYYLLFCSLGLSIEWLLLGNAPTLDPLQVFVQLGMATYWGTFTFMPVMVMEKMNPTIVKKITKSFIAASIFYILLGGLFGKAGVFLGFVVFSFFFSFLNVFYYQYFKRLYYRQPMISKVRSVQEA